MLFHISNKFSIVTADKRPDIYCAEGQYAKFDSIMLERHSQKNIK